MTTLLQLIESTRLAAGDHPTRDTFTGSVLTSDTALTFLDGSKIPAGGLIDTPKFETIRIITKDPNIVASATLVERAVQATSPQAYVAGDDVYVGFRYTYDRYRRALNAALSAISIAFGNPLWDGSQTLSVNQLLYAVPAGALRVTNCRYIPSGLGKMKHLPFSFEPSMPAAAGLAVAGPAVQLQGFNPGTGVLWLEYEKAWTQLTLGTDALDANFPADAIDCIILGAIAYLSDEESFRRTAFDSPHAKQQVFATSSTEVGNDASRHLNRFLLRRQELMAVHRRVNTTWIKG